MESALAAGYRHIDTGDVYGNEQAIGRALRRARLHRKTLHVTSKVWHDHHAPDQIEAALQASLERLDLEFVDLYMIHWPAGDFRLGEMLDVLAGCRERGTIRAIGVCNFPLPLLRKAIEECAAPIAAVQIEYHLLLDQTRIHRYLSGHGIPLIAFCPLAQGKILEHPAVHAIAAKHAATPTQIALAWLLSQELVAAIPKSGNPLNQAENLRAADIRLDAQDLTQIAFLPKNVRIANPPFAPAWD